MMSGVSNRLYPSDLTESKWELLQPLLPHPRGIGSPLANEQSSTLCG